jgi:hypothetical protein
MAVMTVFRTILAMLLGVAMLAFPGLALASKEYVLKHPGREHCRAHYVKRSKTVRKKAHGRQVRVRLTVCVYVRPASRPPVKTAPVSTPAPTPVSTPTPVTPTPKVEPFTTTTSLTASFIEESCKYKGNNAFEFCKWTMAYNTTNSHGESAPAPGPILQVRIPPSEVEETLDVPSGSTILVDWFKNTSNECVLYVSSEGHEVGGDCESANPRAVFTASYAQPASGWLASTSEQITLR